MGKIKPRLKGKGKRWPKGQSSNSNPVNNKYRRAARSRFFAPNLGENLYTLVVNEGFRSKSYKVRGDLFFRKAKKLQYLHPTRDCVPYAGIGVADNHEATTRILRSGFQGIYQAGTTPHLGCCKDDIYATVNSLSEVTILDKEKDRTNSALTVGAIKTLDAFNGQLSLTHSFGSKKDDATSTYSGFSDATSSAKTFASYWSNCSNVSFNKLLDNFQPNSAHQKEMLAILAAIGEVIRNNGGHETSTEYFGALMTSLETSESEESVAAILSLLRMGIKSVPEEVLRKTFSISSKAFSTVLEKYAVNENQVIIRSVRKYAQQAVCAILKGSKFFRNEDTHPGAEITGKFCIQQIESGAISGGCTTALHILQLLKEILYTFPKPQIKTACETLLKLLTLGNVLVTACSFQALHGLFISNPPSNRLTSTLNGQLINALYEYQPPANDWNTTLAWLAVMQEAHVHLIRTDPNLCAEHLFKLFKTVTDLWLSDNVSLLNGVTLTLRTIAMECIPLCNQHWNYKKIVQSIFEIVEGGIKYQYRNAWPQVLNLLSCFFEVIGPDGESYFMNCLKSLGQLRDSEDFPYPIELENTIGRAIRFLGPEIVAVAIPMEILGNQVDYEFKRSWMLPLLRENVQGSTLKFYIENFLPLASLCKKKVDELRKDNDNVGMHSYGLLQSQIWGLFPSFCNNAKDVASSFKSIAKILGTCLTEFKEHRLPILSGLRKLITKAKENNNETDCLELGKYAKNYLPILFNLYTTKAKGTDEEGQRLAAFETIKIYLSIASRELSLELFDKAISHLDNEFSDQFMKECVMDLIKTLITYLDETRLEKIYTKCLSFLKSTKDAKLEKKCYRLVEELCKAESDVCKTFLTKHFDKFQKFLLKSLKGKKAVANKGARLRCLLQLVKMLPENQYHIIKEIIPETVLCCKDMNAKCRACAFELLIDMFNISKTWAADKTDDDLIRDYMGVLMGGLAGGSATLTSATVLGLTKLTFTLRDQIPPDLLQLLLENIVILAAAPNREIATACLSFVKTFIVVIPFPIVSTNLSLLMKSVLAMTDDCKRHSRLKIRDILDRLLRKFGYQTIYSLIPSDDTIMIKRLKNLRKINDRKKKMKDSIREEENEEDKLSLFSAKKKTKSIEEILASSDDESDLESDKYTTRSSKSNKSNKSSHGIRKNEMQMFIKEDADDIVDLVSPAAVGKLTSTKLQDGAVGQMKKRKEPHFKTASDGRLIITDLGKDEEDYDQGGRKRKHTEFGEDDDYEDIDEVSDKLSSVHLAKKMKKGSADSVRSSYTAGGSGIHRPIKTSKLSKKRKDVSSIKTGKEYKAKKARGDVKIKGKPDPYAYVPLSRKLLNKRKKAQTAGRFKSVLTTKKGKK